MNAPRFLVRLLAVALGLPCFGAWGADAPKPAVPAAAANPAEAAKNAPPKTKPVQPPSETELRAAINKSLKFLAEKGDEWITDQKCNSCHHLPGLLWSHREAKRRGFAIDDKKFEEWLEWSTKEASKPFIDEAALLLFIMPDRAAPEWVKIVASAQRPDGCWIPSGQLAGMQKRGGIDAKAYVVRLCLLALSASQPAHPELETARTKAAGWLQKKDEPTTVESLLFRILYAESIGHPDEAKATREQIVKLQRHDGGWSYGIGENMSDPLGTGQALYALQPASSDPKTADAIARAQKWLLKTQREDGTWPIDFTHLSRVDRSADERPNSQKGITAVYTYWGAAWSTIGLLQAVPLTNATATTANR